MPRITNTASAGNGPSEPPPCAAACVTTRSDLRACLKTQQRGGAVLDQPHERPEVERPRALLKLPRLVCNPAALRSQTGSQGAIGLGSTILSSYSPELAVSACRPPMPAR